jgi:3'-phosphoadenosine 5'-phosphosulfate sulfotransferase (PAPS reductase)/FAD synthetase
MSDTIYHVGVSGGKDSAACLLWLRYKSGIDPADLIATFSDTGNEHDLTYQHVAYLSEHVHPIQTLKPPLDFYELAESKGRFPSARARFCTEHLKLNVTFEFLASLPDDNLVVTHSGVRADESPERAKLKEVDSIQMSSAYDYRELEVRRPLLTWTLDDVLAIHKEFDVLMNPLYKMGFRRVGCMPCVMSRKEEIRLIAHTFPDRIDRIRKLENKMGTATFFHANTVPLSQRSQDYTTKGGEEIKIATIDDVVRWSHTSHGGQQYPFEFEDGPNDGSRPCANKFGYCE